MKQEYINELWTLCGLQPRERYDICCEKEPFYPRLTMDNLIEFALPLLSECEMEIVQREQERVWRAYVTKMADESLEEYVAETLNYDLTEALAQSCLEVLRK